MEINVNTLRLNSVIPFVLYTRIEGEYLIYRRDKLPFTVTQRQALLDNEIDVIHISSDHVELYWEYLKENIKRIIDDDTVSVGDRAAIFYHASSELSKEIIEVPITVENVENAQTLIHESIKLCNEGKVALHGLMSQMESRPSIYSHALNVCQYGVALTREIDGSIDQEAIGMGLLFQDIGMLQLPEHLPYKAGPLSFDEWSMIKRHPALGLEALAGMTEVPELSRHIVFGHHERLDGSGYPQGLTGSEVSMPTRIAGVADTFATLTSTCHGQTALDTFAALRMMQGELSGTLDPMVMTAFIKLLGI